VEQLGSGIGGAAAATAWHSSSSVTAAEVSRINGALQQVFDSCLDKNVLIGKLTHQLDQLTSYIMQQGVDADELRSSLEESVQQVQQLTSKAAQLEAENQRLTEQVRQAHSTAQLKLAQIQLVLGGEAAVQTRAGADW
jgi:phage shock protein A